MTPIAPLRLPLALAFLGLVAGTDSARAQGQACQIARAELAAFDRNPTTARSAGEVDRLIAYYHSAGCGRAPIPFLTSRPPQCGQIEARIAQLQSSPARGDAARRDRLIAAVEARCASHAPLGASSRDIDDLSGGRSRIVIDDAEQPATDEEPRRPALGRAMCVRACDGFYFPLTTSPNGREGADDMCQALCPASPARAYFIDKGGVDQATNTDGQRYAKAPNAYRFRREVSASCGCRPNGQPWSKALQRAEEMVPQGPDDVVVREQDQTPLPNAALRPGAAPDAPTRRNARRPQAIDPGPRDDGMLEPDPVPAEPSGIAVMTPKPPPPPPEPVAAPAPKGPVRVVAPSPTADSGRPQPLPKSN